MCVARVGEFISDDRWRADCTGIEKREYPLEMSAVAYDVRPQGFDVSAGRSKPVRCRSNPDQSPARPQDRVAPRPDIAADRIEHHVAVGSRGGKILAIVVDHPICTEPRT